MSDALQLDGQMLYHGLVSGYVNVLKNKKELNRINVFPVQDGDTGSNIAATLKTIVDGLSENQSAGTVLQKAADLALVGARGNSGIIFAQFFNSLASNAGSEERIHITQFINAVEESANTAGEVIETPIEGTILTVLKHWAHFLKSQVDKIEKWEQILFHSLEEAKIALQKTPEQLSILKEKKVVDAGAKGFVYFLEGIAQFVKTRKPLEYTGKQDNVEIDESLVEHSDEALTYRYCSEFLLNKNDVQENSLKKDLRSFGDSLIVSEGQTKIRVHIHTNNVAELAAELMKDYTILHQKVDDMLLQQAAIHTPLSKVAIVTDSIADISEELRQQYHIHLIPQSILWGDSEYLDRVTMTGDYFYAHLDSNRDYPSSSIPELALIERQFRFLGEHYDYVLALPVAKALSGTWNAMNTIADKLNAEGMHISVLDTKLNSAAQGLLVVDAAMKAAAGADVSSLIKDISEAIPFMKIFVSVQTFKYMVRGGRVSPLKGFIAKTLNMKPIVSLDKNGKGTAFSTSFSQKGVTKKIVKLLHQLNNDYDIKRYAIVHAASEGKAKEFAVLTKSILGKEAEYLTQISPLVGLHAGIGAIAIALHLEKR